VVLRGLLFLKFKYCISARNKAAKLKNKMLPEPILFYVLLISKVESFIVNKTTRFFQDNLVKRLTVEIQTSTKRGPPL
jgi:hypothetical protein